MKTAKIFYDPRPFSTQSKRRAIQDLVENTIPDRDFYLLVIGAILLAISGIFLDSIPVLIASMVVAPLASPLLLFSLGAVVDDKRLMKKATAMLFVSMLMALILSAGASFVAEQMFGIRPEGAMISFSPNLFFDIFIALLSGFLATYGLIRDKVGSAMIGIGIAVSLMPPLVATGIHLANFNQSAAMDAGIIFVLNVFGILVASIGTFALFGFSDEYK